MIENLMERGINLLGYPDCPTCEAQKERFNRIFKPTEGEGKAECFSMFEVYRDKLNGEGEKDRIEKIEMLDEFEEWQQLQEHYCLVLGTRGKDLQDLHI